MTRCSKRAVASSPSKDTREALAWSGMLGHQPMTDSLGFRRKFGVIAPSTNTSVQPEFEAMRPRGVTNHFGRIHIPNDPIKTTTISTSSWTTSAPRCCRRSTA